MIRLKWIMLLISGALFGLLISNTCYCQNAPDQYERAMKRVRLLSESTYVRLLSFGKSNAGRKIPAMIISDFKTDSKDKARIFICAGQHGDEYNAVSSILFLCEDLTSGLHPRSLSNYLFIVVPMINPDGAAANQRLNAQGIDINRDWPVCKTPEVRYVQEIIRTWKPHLLIDAHEWTGPSPVPGNEIEVARSASSSQEGMMANLAAAAAKRADLIPIFCSTHCDGSLFHRYFSKLGYAAYLIGTAQNTGYTAKQRIYYSAITTMVSKLAKGDTNRQAISPASANFDITAIEAYLQPAWSRTAFTESPSFMALIAIFCCLIIWVAKQPNNKSKDEEWSHKFIKCSIDADIAAHSLGIKHAPKPITARSWINRRTRARFVESKQENPRIIIFK